MVHLYAVLVKDGPLKVYVPVDPQCPLGDKTSSHTTPGLIPGGVSAQEYV
jgi:hypothetical protein